MSSEDVADPKAGAEDAPDAAPARPSRVPGDVRREQILEAASRVFGERGYVGATTDQVAREAGISQPYVVRMFGSKESLFIAVLDRALDRLTVAFRDALEESARRNEDHDVLVARLGAAYADLIMDRGILLSLMQAFISGHEPVIGERARTGFMQIYEFLRDEAAIPPEEIVGFLAHGMLFNVLIAMRLLDRYENDGCVTELLQNTFRAKLDLVLKAITVARG